MEGTPKPPENLKLTCKNYPPEFTLDRDIAKAYFKQFGQIKRILFRPKTQSCVVEYASREGFLEAIEKAGEFNGHTFDITVDKAHRDKVAGRRRRKTTGPIWLDEDELQEELDAMAGKGRDPREQLNVSQKGSASTKVSQDAPKGRKSKSAPTTNKKKQKQDASLSSEDYKLINVVLSQCFDVDDKFKVLDARDKLMRAKLKKYAQIKSKATLGTCPDMCPEKERLMRDAKHQVALFEQLDNGKSMDYRKAIKQYSRSSADQEAPLPHELRPVPVLQMTMGYLLHNIINLGDDLDVNIGEWYHFIWDRMRGVRKDITQQELCCQGSVELVEQCARFHIHCSARLIREEPSMFDQKINTENLTKCLQSLKYMYHDLELKGEFCPNEAEFRAYIILLNLNDGNFMWEVQQLRPEIQKSPNVRFALEIHSALDKNNYVKFFKLLYETTYLNACILMRYFVQVRVTALKILSKCYSTRAYRAMYPLSDLTTLLGFDDLDSTIDFARYHGLTLNEDYTHIILEKNSFALPEVPYPLDRSMNVVESKRVHSVGWTICGKELPRKTFEGHVLQDSFNEVGFLISTDFIEEFDLEQAKINLSAELEEDSEVEPVKEDITDFQEDITDFQEDMQEEMKPKSGAFKDFDFFSPKESTNIFAQPLQPTTSIFTAPMNIFSFAQNSNKDEVDSNSMFGFAKQPEPGADIPSMPDTNFSFKFVSPTDQHSKPKPKIKGGFTFNLTSAEPPKVSTPPKESYFPIVQPKSKSPDENQQVKLNAEKLLKEMEELERRKVERERVERKRKEEQEREAKKRRQEEELKKRLELEEQEEENLRLSSIKSVVKDVVKTLVTRVDNRVREQALDRIRSRIRHRRALTAFKKWRENVHKNKRKRKAIDCSPVWISTKTTKQTASELYTPSQDLTLSLMKRYRYGKSLDFDITTEKHVEEIDLVDLTYNTLKKRFYDLIGTIQKNIYWKVVISLPDSDEMVQGLHRIEETITTTINWAARNDEITRVEHVRVNNAESITYCVEKQQGLEAKPTDSNGFIFIAKDFNSILQRRIFENLKHFGVFTKVPIVIILQEYEPTECKLKALIEAKILSDYVILIENLSSTSLVDLIKEGLVFLASKVERPPPLELDTLSSILEKYLCTEMWKRANSFAKWNCHYKQSLKNPKVVISLYNEALSHLKKILLNKSWIEYMNFPEVFEEYLRNEIPDFLPCSYHWFPKFWKNPTYTYKMENLLKQMSLPKWQENWPPSSELELEVAMSKYCTKAFKEPEKPFYKTMSILLRDVDPNETFADIVDVFWTDLIEVLGLEKLRQINWSFAGTEFDNKSVYNQYIAVYNNEAMRSYSRSDWFYVNNPMVKSFIRELLRKKKEDVPNEQTIVCASREELDSICQFAERVLNTQSKIKGLEKELNEFDVLFKDLDTSIKTHKRISSKLDEFLKTSIEEN